MANALLDQALARAAANREAQQASITGLRERALQRRLERQNQTTHTVTSQPVAQSQPAPVPAPATSNALSPQQQAFQAFYDTPLYQFPLQEGLDAINSNYAARGMLQSGAAQKAISDYAAGMASGGLRDYFSLLGNQQGLGFAATSAQGGLAQGYANTIGGMNTNYANALTGINSGFANNATNLTSGLGNAYAVGAQNTGNALSNAAIANANNNNAMISGIGNAIGGAVGALSYQPYAGLPTSTPPYYGTSIGTGLPF